MSHKRQTPKKGTVNFHSIDKYLLFYRWPSLQVWINQGDIILIGLRDYQDAKADVILKYTPDEARNLKTYGEFPESVRINDTVTFVEEGFDEDIEFGDDISSADEADPVDGIWWPPNGASFDVPVPV